MRRKSLIELAKKLRRTSTSAGSSSSNSSPSKSSINENVQHNHVSSSSKSDELDENGNIISTNKKKTKSTTRRYSDFDLIQQADSTVGKCETNRRKSQQITSNITKNDINEIVASSKQPPCRRKNQKHDSNEKIQSALEEKSWLKVTRQLRRMTNDELESLLNVDDQYVMDCLIDQKPIIKKLTNERDELKKQVSSLAEANYACEPEFVRDRLRLRQQGEELAKMVKQLQFKHMEPILIKLNDVQTDLARNAVKREELSEAMAHDFLTSKIVSYESFVKDYISIRKEASKKRILADHLAKERDLLMSNIVYKSLLITGKQQSNKSATASETASITSAESLIITTTTTPSSQPEPASTNSVCGFNQMKKTIDLTTNDSLTDLNESPKPTPRQRKRVSFNK